MAAVELRASILQDIEAVSISEKYMLRLKKYLSRLRREMSAVGENSAEATTLQAMRDAKLGNTIKCSSFEDYLEKVK
jgi:uncharacterized protein YigA (DUF484 family)